MQASSTIDLTQYSNGDFIDLYPPSSIQLAQLQSAVISHIVPEFVLFRAYLWIGEPLKYR
jgi:hypothetical protein